MKKTLFICELLLLICGKAGSTILENPIYEFKNSGIENVIKIELNKHETRIHVHCTFIPNWWVKFPTTTFIRETGTDQKILATGIIGGEFGKEIYMPASGDSTFILIFPPLDKKIKKIDYGEDTKASIYGISLDKKQKKQNTVHTVPAEVEKWIGDELRNAPVKEPLETDIHTDSFFNPKKSRIVGYIKGYDPRLDFNTGIIYIENVLTRENFPTVVEIHPDGRFETEFQIKHPLHSHIFLSNRAIPFYTEPGQVLGMILDWEEFLVADRKRNIRYRFKDIDFRGPLSTTNRELLKVELKSHDYKSLEQATKSTAPDEFKEKQYEIIKENTNLIQTALKKGEISPKSAALLDMESRASFGTFLFDYINDRRYYGSQEPENTLLKAKLPKGYYDFLQYIPWQNPFLLTADVYDSFINRFEYCEPFSNALARNPYAPLQKPEKTFLEYIETLGIKLNDEEQALKIWADTLERVKYKENKEKVEQMQEKIRAFNEKHKEHIPQYRKLYIDTIPPTSRDQILMDEWKAKDSVLIHELGLTPNLSYEIAKVRSLDRNFSYANKEESERLLQAMVKNLSHPYLKQEAERIFRKNHPSESNEATELPEGKATEIFRKIIDPHKGKILFVDFWATWCGPCVSGIKRNQEIRKKYKDNPDFDFIFITDEGSPQDQYDSFIKEQDMQHTYRLTTDEYNYLRQLFRFNGIPRYIVIDAQGRLLNGNFSMHQFEYELMKILGKDKTENDSN